MTLSDIEWLSQNIHWHEGRRGLFATADLFFVVRERCERHDLISPIDIKMEQRVRSASGNGIETFYAFMSLSCKSWCHTQTDGDQVTCWPSDLDFWPYKRLLISLHACKLYVVLTVSRVQNRHHFWRLHDYPFMK